MTKSQFFPLNHSHHSHMHCDITGIIGDQPAAQASW